MGLSFFGDLYDRKRIHFKLASNYYFDGGIVASYKIFIKYLSIFLIVSLFSSLHFANASAAEKWAYEPVMKDMNIHVKAHKVDQYGNAVNDYEYNTKIDPKTTANKQKMGTVGFGRLLKSTGWGLLGAAALEGLLTSVDWVLDPETQSIWRNKKNPDPSYGTCYGGKYLFTASTGYTSTCPIEAIQKYWAAVSNSSVQYKFKEWIDSPDDVLVYKTKTRITYIATGTTSSGTNSYPNQFLAYSNNPNYVPETPVKEYLTPEALADYANHTHSDYADPQLAPKLAPKYSPNIASDLWKPSNQWETNNSPTVQEVNNQLEKANPEPVKPPEITPNPETGGSVLPSFCSWAVTVCDFINWVKQDRDSNSDEVDIETQDLQPETVDINFVSGCPAPIVFIDSDFYGQPFKIEFSFDSFCSVLSDWVRPILISMGAFISVLILGGVKTNE